MEPLGASVRGKPPTIRIAPQRNFWQGAGGVSQLCELNGFTVWWRFHVSHREGPE